MILSNRADCQRPLTFCPCHKVNSFCPSLLHGNPSGSEDPLFDTRRYAWPLSCAFRPPSLTPKTLRPRGRWLLIVLMVSGEFAGLLGLSTTSISANSHMLSTPTGSAGEREIRGFGWYLPCRRRQKREARKALNNRVTVSR